MTTRAEVVAEARTYIGTRFRHQGRLKGVGVDCIGLAGGVAVALGLPGSDEWMADRRYHNYGMPPNPALLIDACDRFMDRIEIEAAGLGDVLVMRFVEDPQHFAIVSRESPTYIIHAYAMGGVKRVVEQGVKVAGAVIVRAYRFRGIED